LKGSLIASAPLLDDVQTFNGDLVYTGFRGSVHPFLTARKGDIAGQEVVGASVASARVA